MAAITWAEASAFAVDLASITDEAVQTDILAHVNNALKVELFGGETSPRLRMARMLLAAHIGSIILNSEAGPSAGSGAVTSESVDGLSRSYDVSSAASSDLNTTAWGAELYSMLRNSGARAPFIIPTGY